MNEHEEMQGARMWALSKHGAQIIDPASELAQKIINNVWRAERYSIATMGRIVIETTPPIIIDPRSVGIERKKIYDYKTPEHIAINGLRHLYKN